MTHIELKAMGDRIKWKRMELRYTQEQFAELIEISSSSYTRIENAFQKPALDTLIKISKHLNLSLDYIVYGDNDEYEKNKDTDVELLRAILDFSDKEKILHASEVLKKIAKIK